MFRKSYSNETVKIGFPRTEDVVVKVEPDAHGRAESAALAKPARGHAMKPAKGLALVQSNAVLATVPSLPVVSRRSMSIDLIAPALKEQRLAKAKVEQRR